MPERATVLNRSEKSAEAVVPEAGPVRSKADEEGPNELGGPKAMSLGRRASEVRWAGRNAGGRGEAAPKRCAMKHGRCGMKPKPGRDGLLAQALASGEHGAAWKRVKTNRGSAGVDGLSIAETADFLRAHWPRIRGSVLMAATGLRQCAASRSRSPMGACVSWGSRR